LLFVVVVVAVGPMFIIHACVVCVCIFVRNSPFLFPKTMGNKK
jgi:hypothetical protein